MTAVAKAALRCSPFFLLALQDDVVLDQGGLSFAHPARLRRNAHPPPPIGAHARAPGGDENIATRGSGVER